ncbi:hypothetical protein [Endozoicomonas sp. 8E]|uniref:hypothetical protein n=1 Tax=Endozoicomonas sp. 8E TaxID=3035692 RepID=UPI0029394EB7|nr:hypothetical protein [Endozoicomonas sp. 8E]WOG27617.1 hypothetical protein P6910_24225 [Endozoicomonas sp. 8E]
MATPAGTANRPLESGILLNQDVEVASELPSKHSGHTAIYSLHQCKALTEILSKMREATIVDALPEAPVPGRFKSLKSRTAAVSSFWQRSSTDSGKPVQASKTEILAELDKMDERLQKYYQRICQLHSQLTKTLEIALQTETALSNDIPFYEEAFKSQHKEQQELQLMADKLQKQTKMLEAKDREVRELCADISFLKEQAKISKEHLNRARDQQSIKAIADERVRQLENDIRNANSNSTSIQKELKTVREEKKQLAHAFSKIGLKKFSDPQQILKLLQDLESANRIVKSSRDQSERIVQLEELNNNQSRDLREVRRRLEDSESYVLRIRAKNADLSSQNEQLKSQLAKANTGSERKIHEDKGALTKRAEKLEKDLAEANRNYQESIRTIREENAVLNRGYQETIRIIQAEKDVLNRAYQETIKVNQEQADHLNWRISKAQHTAGSHQDDDIRARLERLEQSRPTEQLENDLRQKATMLKATQEQLSEVESQKARMLKKLKNMHKKLTAKGIDVVPKNTLTELQNNLQRTQSLLQQKEDEVTAWVNRSRQWETDRAALEREIETLRALPGRFIQDNPTSGDESPLIRRSDSQTV